MMLDLPFGGDAVIAPWFLVGTAALLLVWPVCAAYQFARDVHRSRAHERATERSVADAPLEERALIRENALRRHGDLRDAIADRQIVLTAALLMTGSMWFWLFIIAILLPTYQR